MLSKLSKNQQRNTQNPKFSRLRRSREQKVIQSVYIYIYVIELFLSELFLGIIFGENPAAKRPEFFFFEIIFWENSVFEKLSYFLGKSPKPKKKH